MIERDADGVLLDGGAENVARGDGGVGGGADEDLALAEDVLARVEKIGAEPLLALPRHGAHQLRAGGVGVERRTRRRLLRGEAAGDLERSGDPRRLRRPHPVKTGDVRGIARGELGEAPPQQLARQLHGVLPVRPAAEKDADQLRVGESARSVFQQTLARAIVDG